MDECYSLDNDPDFSNHNSTRFTKRHLIWIGSNVIDKDNFDIYKTLRIQRGYRYQKSFLRFKLHDNDPTFVYNAIKEISKITLDFVKIYDNVNNNHSLTYYSISLLLILILLEENGEKIDLIDVEQMVNHYTKNELENMIKKQDKNNNIIINNKYIFKDEKCYYLDIPLCDEFYNFDHIINKIGDYDKYWKINCDISFEYFDSIELGYENASYLSESNKSNLQNSIVTALTTYNEQILLTDNILLIQQYELVYWKPKCKTKYKNIYVVIAKDSIVIPVLIKPFTAIMYDNYDYIAYKIDVNDDDFVNLEFDNVKQPIMLMIIKTKTC
jgi:hypothetical protein